MRKPEKHEWIYGVFGVLVTWSFLGFFLLLSLILPETRPPKYQHLRIISSWQDEYSTTASKNLTNGRPLIS